MRRDVLELREFYATPLGRAAREMTSRKVIEAWGDASGMDVLALGYATPFVGALRPAARRVAAAMPAQQGVEVWPLPGPNLTCLAEENALPFANALFDRILVVHMLEESADPLAFLQEVWRVLAPSGRVIVAVASRNGLWANTETTPFGHGRPYSRRQLASLLREAELEPLGWTRAIYVPPVAWMAGAAEFFEQAGSRLWPGFSGILLMDAVKQTFAVKARAERVRPRIPVPVLNPAPVAGAPVSQAPRPPYLQSHLERPTERHSVGRKPRGRTVGGAP